MQWSITSLKTTIIIIIITRHMPAFLCLYHQHHSHIALICENVTYVWSSKKDLFVKWQALDHTNHGLQITLYEGLERSSRDTIERTSVCECVWFGARDSIACQEKRNSIFSWLK